MDILVIVICLVWAGNPADCGLVGSPNIGQPTNSELSHRSVTAVGTDVHAALCAEAATRRAGDNTRDVLRLVALYREMAAHPQHETSLTLKQLGLQTRKRLEIVHDHISRTLARQKPEIRILAQQLPPAGGGNALAPPSGGPTSSAVTPTDFGPELVELIEQTISPATWNINGGNGAVVYFAPVRGLVVRAPENVHEQVADLLWQLRAAP